MEMTNYEKIQVNTLCVQFCSHRDIENECELTNDIVVKEADVYEKESSG